MGVSRQAAGGGVPLVRLERPPHRAPCRGALLPPRPEQGAGPGPELRLARLAMHCRTPTANQKPLFPLPLARLAMHCRTTTFKHQPSLPPHHDKQMHISKSHGEMCSTRKMRAAKVDECFAQVEECFAEFGPNTNCYANCVTFYGRAGLRPRCLHSRRSWRRWRRRGRGRRARWTCAR